MTTHESSPSVTAGSVDHRRPDLVGLPIGPGSLTWRINGDSRALLLIGRTGVLQNMHPAVSQALLDHSNYFADPIGRISRSIPQILGVIYDEDHDGMGVRVRDWHQPIRAKAGADYQYRALDPSVFYWTHATFVEAAIETQRLWGTALTRGELERYYRESITWWRRYGMSMAPVPENYDAFRRYWDEMLANELQATPVAIDAVETATMPTPPPGVPAAVWNAVGERAAVFGAQWITKATLPPAAREILGIRWTRRDERLARAYVRSVRLAWHAVPPRARRLPRAAEADRRLALAA
ncbi:MAG: DUF2236 domain-containing protein [Solirubrobacteraceae bacterium]|nr:DUF2236 domain-containing protein [Solirubrobacteraceae bacterium]